MGSIDTSVNFSRVILLLSKKIDHVAFSERVLVTAMTLPRKNCPPRKKYKEVTAIRIVSEKQKATQVVIISLEPFCCARCSIYFCSSEFRTCTFPFFLRNRVKIHAFNCIKSRTLEQITVNEKIFLLKCSMPHFLLVMRALLPHSRRFYPSIST